MGHIVSGEGVRPDPENVEVLRKLKPSTTLKQLQLHLGCYIQEGDVMCQYIFSGLQIGKNKVIERKFEIVKGVIYRKLTKKVPTSRIIKPLNGFPDIFKQYHVDISGEHFGFNKTMARINQYFWHPLLNRVIEDKIRSCEECQ